MELPTLEYRIQESGNAYCLKALSVSCPAFSGLKFKISLESFDFNSLSRAQMPEGVTICNAYAPKGLDRDCRMWNTVAVTPGRLRSLASMGVKSR